MQHIITMIGLLSFYLTYKLTQCSRTFQQWFSPRVGWMTKTVSLPDHIRQVGLCKLLCHTSLVVVMRTTVCLCVWMDRTRAGLLYICFCPDIWHYVLNVAVWWRSKEALHHTLNNGFKCFDFKHLKSIFCCFRWLISTFCAFQAKQIDLSEFMTVSF